MPVYTIPSVPATFNMVGVGAVTSVTFAIPVIAGPFSGTFQMTHTRSFAMRTTDSWAQLFLTASGTTHGPLLTGNGVKIDVATLDAFMLSDVTAAMGGNLTVTISEYWPGGVGLIDPGDSDLVSEFLLILSTSGGGAANRKDVIVCAPQLGAVQYGVVRS